MAISARSSKQIEKGILIILLLAFLLRSANLEHLPVFYDEANYIRWSQQTYDRLDLTIGLGAVSTLQLWILAPLLNLSPSALWIGRFVSVIVGLLTVALCYAIGRQLYRNQKVGQLSALLYALLPYAVFHERLAQHDGLLSFFLAFVVYLNIRIFDPRFANNEYRHSRQRFTLALVLVVVFGLVLLAKRSAILFIGTSFLTVFVFYGWKRARQNGLWALGLFGGMVFVTLPVIWITSNTADQLAAQVADLNWTAWVTLLRVNIGELWDWYSSYFLLPAFAFFCVATLYNLIFHRRHDVLPVR